MHLLPSGPLKDITGFWIHCTCNSAWKKSLEETVGSICKGRLKLPQSTRHSQTSLPTVQCLKKKTVALHILFNFLVVWCTQGNLVPITIFWQKVKIRPANTFLINSCPFKTVGISCSPVSIWQLHISFFCSSLSLP